MVRAEYIGLPQLVLCFFYPIGNAIVGAIVNNSISSMKELISACQ
jgi:hypothetical protein